MDWVQIKAMLSETALHKDALHIYAAVAVQVGAAIISRRSLGSIVPWLTVLMAQSGNEYLDLRWGETETVEEWQVAGSLHDMWNTMLLPTVLLLLVRLAPRLFIPVAKSATDPAA